MVEVIPVGYRLRPTDEELIDYFLKRKIMGRQIDTIILEKSMYGDKANPWDVIKDDDPWEDLDSPTKKVIYIFCKLIMKNGKSRVVRTAGCGTWDGKAVSHKIRNSKGKIIGQKRAFTFKAKKDSESEMKGKGRWIMHEFSLLDYGNCEEEYVICRITKELLKGICPRKVGGSRKVVVGNLGSKNVVVDNDDFCSDSSLNDDSDVSQKKSRTVVELRERQEINSSSSSRNIINQCENAENVQYTSQPASIGLDGFVTRNPDAISQNCKEHVNHDIIPYSAGRQSIPYSDHYRPRNLKNSMVNNDVVLSLNPPQFIHMQGNRNQEGIPHFEAMTVRSENLILVERHDPVSMVENEKEQIQHSPENSDSSGGDSTKLTL